MGVRSRLWREGRLVETDFPLEDLDVHLSTPGELVWLDVCMAGGAHADLLEELADELQLDRHAVEDAVAPGGASQGHPSREAPVRVGLRDADRAADHHRPRAP